MVSQNIRSPDALTTPFHTIATAWVRFSGQECVAVTFKLSVATWSSTSFSEPASSVWPASVRQTLKFFSFTMWSDAIVHHHASAVVLSFSVSGPASKSVPTSAVPCLTRTSATTLESPVCQLAKNRIILISLVILLIKVTFQPLIWKYIIASFSSLPHLSQIIDNEQNALILWCQSARYIKHGSCFAVSWTHRNFHQISKTL